MSANSLTQSQVKDAFVFINYASTDKQYAEVIYNHLNDNGYAGQVWLDRESLSGGDDWKRKIDSGLKKTFVMVSLLTSSSVDPKRWMITYEQDMAQQRFIPIIPIMFETVDLPERFKHINFLDFRDEQNQQIMLDKLLLSINNLSLRLGKSLVDQTPPERRLFIGRQNDLQRIFDIIHPTDLESDSSIKRIIAIQGMAGTGKSMVAQEICRRIGTRYPGGVIYETRGEHPENAQTVLRKWASYAIGEYPERNISPAELRSIFQKYGEILVVLDDVWAEDFVEVQTLLEALPVDTTRIITTQFRAEAEAIGCTVYPLSNLGYEDTEALIASRFNDKDSEIPDKKLIKELHQIVKGHTLSLELVAGRCEDAEDFADILDELHQDLESGDLEETLSLELAISNRENSVAICLGQSLRALELADAERKKRNWVKRFVSLGVFPNNAVVDENLIAAIWQESGSKSSVRKVLNVFSNRALLTREDQEKYKEKQYSMHPLLSTYARNLLREQNADDYLAIRDTYFQYIINQSHVGFNLPNHLWGDLEPLLPHITEVAKRLRMTLEQAVGDLNNMSSAEPEFMPIGGSIDPALQKQSNYAIKFTSAVMPYVLARPEIGVQGLNWLQLGLVAARYLRVEAQEIKFLKAIGDYFSTLSNYEQALEYYKVAEELCEAGSALYADMLGARGAALTYLSRLPEAKLVAQEALQLHQEHDNKESEAKMYHILGRIYWNSGDGENALEYYNQSIQLYKALKNIEGAARGENLLGSAYFVLANYENAIEHFKHGLKIARQLDRRSLVAENLNDLAAANIYRKDYEEALPFLEEALTIYVDIGNRRMESIVLYNLSAVLSKLGRLDEALHYGRKALQIAEEIKTLKELSWSLHQLGVVYMLRDDAQAAIDYLERAESYARELDNARTLAGILANLGWVLRFDAAQNDRAINSLQEALQLMETNKLTIAHTNVSLEDVKERLKTLQDQTIGG